MIFPELGYDHDELGRLYIWVHWYEVDENEECYRRIDLG